MLITKDCIEMLFTRYPDFHKTWDEYISYWDVDPNEGYIYMNVFTDYVIPLLEKNDNQELLKDIFDFTEKLLVEGAPDVEDAVTTCFLENIINLSDRGSFSPLTFVNLLGEKSKKYCKSWDEFSGVKTKGLWGDNK